MGFALSLFAINTWVLPYLNFGPNVPSWTICTLFFWYWCFPFILPRLQRLNDRKIAYGIVKYFWLQIGLAVLVAIGFGMMVTHRFEVILSKIINSDSPCCWYIVKIHRIQKMCLHLLFAFFISRRKVSTG